MKSINRVIFLSCLSATITVALASNCLASPADVKSPAAKKGNALATVNGESITIEQFARHFALIHEGATDIEQVRKTDPAQILDRMVNIRLIVQEAENIGLEELPEVKGAMEKFRDGALRNLLFGAQMRKVGKPDQKEVDKIFRGLVKEIALASIRFDDEEKANEFRASVKSGKDFPGLARKAVEEKRAEGSEKENYLKAAELQPDVAAAVSKMKKGEVSPVIKLGKHFAIVRVGAVRYPENAEKRKEAEKLALQRKRSDALRKYVDSLLKKYVKPDNALIKELDFEAETPGFDNLLKDERPVAAIKGESPVTVKEWAEALNRIYFHGIEQSIKQKRVNSKKDIALSQILEKKVVLKEAMRLKLDRSAEFRTMVRENRGEMLFGTFVAKVVDPESRIDEEELKTYMKENVKDFTTPEMIRMEFLVFNRKDDAEDAIGKLRAGAELQWMRANAPGQAEASASADLMEINGKFAVRSALPDALRQAVAGAAGGDLRLHTPREGLPTVVLVREVAPSTVEEYENVKERLAGAVFAEKRKKVLEDWIEKLRKASKIEIHAKGDQLRRMLEMQAW